MKSQNKNLKLINQILQSNDINQSLDDLMNCQTKSRKKLLKKLREQLKELEFLKRTGGITVVITNDYVLTTYLNNSMNRKINSTKNKVVY